MNKIENIAKLVNLTPRLKRPLSLWNPLDYLRLLYWVFFFPQALPWYIKSFGNPEYPDQGKHKILEALRRDPVQRRLAFQSLALLLFIVSIVLLGLFLLGLKFNWFILTVGAVLGIISGGIVGAALGIAFGAPFGVTFGVTFGIVGSIIELIFNSTFNQNYISIFGLVFGTALGAAAGMALNAAGCVKSGVDDDIVKGITGGMFFILTGGIIYAVILVIPSITEPATASILTRNLKNTAFFAIGLGAAFSLFIARIVEYLPLVFISPLIRYVFKMRAGHVVFLPLPVVRKQLEKDLESDWEKGIHNANQALAYTLQFIPVVKAFNNILKRTHQDELLSRISFLVDQTWEWNLIRFCSSSLKKKSLKKALDGLLFLFHRRKPDLTELRLDTPARSACAGFWYWHSREPAKAAHAFANIQELRNGNELYYIADALNKWFEINNDDEYKNKVGGIVEWEKNTRRLKNLPAPELRPGALAVLRKLQEVSLDIDMAITALSPFKRSKIALNTKFAINRLLVEEEKICPNPEWQIIKEIALNWLEILDKSEWEFPEEELKKPVENPYEGSSGLPVIEPTFKGREDIIKRIEEHWATDKNVSTLILYGQRRIGKTSILYNMARRTNSDIFLVYISMQKVGKVTHTGQLLYRFADAISRICVERGLTASIPPNEADYTDMNKGVHALNRLLDKLAHHVSSQKRLVLAIDEFELIQEKIEDKQIDAEILPYLRDMAQEYSWLGMIFAGLHIIEEMGRDYRSAFFGQANYIRVSFLKKEDAFDLIAYPKPPRIAIEYSEDLLEELYRLTAGQPYLIQRLCGELVFQWNERFEKEGEKTPRILTADDIPPVLTSEFFESAAYYFDGVWKSVTENERILMLIIAERQEDTWTLDELADTVKTHPSLDKFSTLKETIDLLKRHDVILEEGGNVRFAGELMRRWVAEKNKAAH